jgi:hypothetical protein
LLFIAAAAAAAATAAAAAVVVKYFSGSQRGSLWPQGYSFCWQMNFIKT